MPDDVRCGSKADKPEWVRVLAITALPRVRFHDLRHAHATHLLASGVHPKIASERLGHSKVGITLDLYSHFMPGMQADAVSLVDAALREAQKRSEEGSGFGAIQRGLCRPSFPF